MRLRLFPPAWLLGLALTCGYGAGASAEAIQIAATPIPVFSRAEPERTLFGTLEFRGGLVLSSGARGFGGYSGLRLDADGARFHAVSDRAHWLSGRIVYEGARPTGIDDTDLSPVLGRTAKPLDGTRDDDTEGLEIDGTTAFICTEGSDNILRFDLSKDAAEARGTPLPMPKEVSGLPGNTGLESIARVPVGAPEAGRLLVISEEAFGKDGHHAGWLVDPEGESAAKRLSVAARDGYAVTDAIFDPDGDLVLLERRYRKPLSLHMRVRRIAGADVKAGAVLDGEVLMEASLAHEIDNMEAISAHRAPDGTIVLTLMSDDNMSLFQRTVMLQFGMSAEATSAQ
ncbi:esterase-like activity of phytase family protein [Terrihabitans sp. B22-R8]|uniref:esterase-like activity of phytase family protein n=1 Tax=Terrihabitans sp. B22-R8 TaxID=3425128 RepID=UPI00403C3A26